VDDLKEIMATEAPAKAPVRRIFAWLGLIAVLAGAVLGSNAFSIRDRLLGSATPKPAPPAAGRVAGATGGQAPAAQTALRSAPWWQAVTTLEGMGTAVSSPFTIEKAAIQWRVKWSCPSGHLVVQAPSSAKPLVDGACPGGQIGYGSKSGAMSVQVKADGPWRLEVSQQIEAPLVEPPAPAMTAAGAATFATGSFYRIDKTGTGKVTIYRQADGRYSIRLDDFFVTPNTDLQLRLSTLEHPLSSEEYSKARSELVAVMDVTAGSLNYTVPEGLDPAQFKSVVIWCAPVLSAYAGATLVTAP